MIKQRWKRLFCGGMASLLLCLGLAGCTAEPEAKEGTDSLKIVATNFALYDFARLYETEGIEAEMLISPGAESHDLEATLSDISAISEADIFLYAGGESDLWVEAAFASLGAAGEKIVRINAMELLEGEAAHTHDEHTEEEHIHDEHTWTSIPNAIALIEELGRAILQVDPTKELPHGAEAYVEQLSVLDSDYRAMMETAKRKEIAVADRFPFTHMAGEYGIAYSAAFDGCSSNVEVPLSVISDMIREVKEKSLPVVFYIEFSDRTAVDAVCEATGAEPLLLHSCHNVTKDELEAHITYLDLMKQNLVNLKKALN